MYHTDRYIPTKKNFIYQLDEMGNLTLSKPEQSKSRFDRYVDDIDNVEDVKGDLIKLKKEINEKEEPISALTDKVESVDIKMNNQEYTWENFVDNLDQEAERIFDKFAKDNERKIKEYIQADDMDGLTKFFNEEIWENVDLGFGLYKDRLDAESIKPFTFDLKALKQDIENEVTTERGNARRSDLGSSSGVEGGQNEKLNEIPELDYVDAYSNFEGEYNLSINKDNEMEKIYKDNHLRKVMEKIFDNEEAKEIRKGTFNINLSKEDGLAGIIIDIREAAEYITELEYENIDDIDKEDPKYTYKRIIDLLGLSIDEEKGIIISSDKASLRKGLKELAEEGIITYNKSIDDIMEFSKIAKILSTAQWKDLDTFAGLVQSKDDVTVAIKEWNNALNMTGQNREKNEKGKEQSSLITSENVFGFLCDFNSDGKLSGDVGTLFGQQIYFAIDQAIKLQNVENPGTGEHVVIHNIIKNMQISDYRMPSPQRADFIGSMIDDPENCSKENLAKLINGYTDEYDERVEGMPEFRIFFLDSIKKINGGSEMATPDLYDTLIGTDAEQILSTYEKATFELETTIDQRLENNKNNNEELKKLIKEEGIVRVKETIFTSLMGILDGVTVTTSNGAITNLQATGIGKSREIDKTRNDVLTTIVESITTGLHYTPKGGLRLSIGTGKSGITDDGRTKRSRGADAGVQSGQGIDLFVQAKGEALRQYNYKQVINANLSEIKSAKYLGLEGGAGASIRKGVELSGGITREQDTEMGINQIDKQYKDVSRLIFDISSMPTDSLLSRKSFEEYFENRIINYSNNINKNNKNDYTKFVETNQQHLLDNLEFIVKYMKIHGFFGDKGKIALLPSENQKKAIKSLINILQSGNMEQRRHDLIAGLHGKIELSKLSFGLTTTPVVIERKGGNSVEGTSTSGGTEEGNELSGGVGDSEIGLGKDKFGIAGFYVGAKISTWKNYYVPQEQQYLYAEYEIGQGIGAKKLENKNTSLEADLDRNAEYLEALYNDNRLECTNVNNTIQITFTPDNLSPELTLERFLNIRATDSAEGKFSIEGNTLIIGNVGDIGAYTITEAKGIRRVLCLGTKKIDDAKKIGKENISNKVAPIDKGVYENKERTKQTIDTNIIDNMSGIGNDKEAVKLETKTFFDSEGKLTTPTGKTVTYEKCEVGQTFKNGTLTISKETNNTYTVRFDASPADKLTITYIDAKEYTREREEKESIVSRQEVINTFAMPKHISDVFVQQTEKELSIFDDYEKTLYREFMENSVDPGLDVFIDLTDYEAAFVALQSILENNAKYDTMTDLKSLMEGNLSKNDKILIVDKFKTIFSYIIPLTDGKIDGANLVGYTNSRGNIYQTMKGPDKNTPYPLSTDYRKIIVNNLKDVDSLSRTRMENLIGFTAFYRLNGTGRKYAMTPIGGTNILSNGNKTSMVEINDNDIDSAQDWFINNLKVNSDNQAMIIEKINTLLAAKNISITQENLEDNLYNLLRGKSILLDSGEKISINANYVFYLLGECGNESIGMDIKSINIEKIKDDGVEGRYSATGESEKIFEYGVRVYSDNHSIASKVNANKYTVGATHHQSTNIYDPTGITNTDNKGGGDNNAGNLGVGTGESEL